MNGYYYYYSPHPLGEEVPLCLSIAMLFLISLLLITLLSTLHPHSLMPCNNCLVGRVWVWGITGKGM